MSILNLDQFTYYPYKLWTGRICPELFRQGEAQKQYWNFSLVFLLFLFAKAGGICTWIRVWLSLSARLNKNKLFFKCQIGRAIHVIRIKQEKAEF